VRQVMTVLMWAKLALKKIGPTVRPMESPLLRQVMLWWSVSDRKYSSAEQSAIGEGKRLTCQDMGVHIYSSEEHLTAASRPVNLLRDSGDYSNMRIERTWRMCTIQCSAGRYRINW
jgi:hypothetical protein